MSQPIVIADYSDEWPILFSRVSRAIRNEIGVIALRIDHIGSTAVPGMDAKDVIDVQVTVASLDAADELAETLTSAGYVHMPVTADESKPDARSTVAEFDHTNSEALWHKRLHCSADPGRPTNVHVRVDGWPNQQFALLFVDWLAANPDAQEQYLAVKRDAERAGVLDDQILLDRKSVV